MSIRSTDGKIEMTLSSKGDTICTGKIKTDNSVAADIQTSELSISTAEINKVFGDNITVVSFKNNDNLTSVDIMKGD